MGNSYGTFAQEPLAQWGRTIQLSADGFPIAKAGAVTIDWTTVPAATVLTTYQDGVIVKVGEKALRYGSVIVRLASGKFGLATDLTPDADFVKGNVYLVNETIKEEDEASNHPVAIDGGRVFKLRILAGGAGQPSFANVDAALPNIRYALD